VLFKIALERCVFRTHLLGFRYVGVLSTIEFSFILCFHFTQDFFKVEFVLVLSVHTKINSSVISTSVEVEFIATNAQVAAYAIEHHDEREQRRRLQEQLRQIIDLDPHMIFAKDAEGRFLLANRAVAEASHNTVLLALFDTLNAVRRAVVWGRLRDKVDRPPADHHSFAEHELLVRAIEERDMDGASQSMLRHLSHVQGNLLAPRAAAE